MRTWLVVAVLLAVIASPMLTQTSVLDDSGDNLQYSNPMQATISPSSGWTTGGDQITITGSGFLDMAWKNLTSDGNAYTWTTTTASYVYYSGWDPSIGVDSNGTVHIAHSNMDSDDFWLSSFDGSTWTHLKIRNCGTCALTQILLLTVMITFTSLIITVCRAQATYFTPCMTEPPGQIIGARLLLRTTKFP